MDYSRLVFQSRVLAASLFLSGAGVWAGAIFQADFRGSGSGCGGPADLVALGGAGELFKYSTNAVGIETVGANGVLQVTQGENTTRGQAGGVILKPAAPATSWAAMYKDGKLNGAVDFFFSSSLALEKDTPHSFVRTFDHDNRQNGGLRLNLQNIGNRLLLELIGPGKDAFVRQNGRKSGAIHIGGTTDLAAGGACHVALTFQTGADGFVTAALHVGAGTGALDPKSSPLGTAVFKLNPELVKAGFTDGRFRVGKLNTAGPGGAIQSFARFSIYDTVPQSFAALSFELGSATAHVQKKK
jgi:hypothetical protein